MTEPKRAARLLSAVLCAFCSACASDTANGATDAGQAAEDAGSPVSDAETAVDAAPSLADAALSEQPLLDHKSWHNFAAELDPLASHQPAVIECGIAGWFIEREQLEVSTSDCNYALLEHPSLLSITAGTEVLLELWHFDLTAPEPAEAHVALLFGDALQWETLIPIPQPGNVQQVSFRATRALAAGEPIRLHLHNHGQNTWLLRTLHALVPAP